MTIRETAELPHVFASKLLTRNFPYDLTPSQHNLVYALGRFLTSTKNNCTMVVKGYAGTGKTTMVNSLVKSLPQLKQKAVLLAPTGRAAKILGQYSGQQALTIHKKIYFRNSDSEGFSSFTRAKNLHKNTVFVVDEASMIGWADLSGQSETNLLKDLFEYVFTGQNCRLILIGDGAQLPPVHSEASPALDLEFLKAQFDITIALCELTDVVRQEGFSGILDLATQLRYNTVASEKQFSLLKAPEKPDVRMITGLELQEELENNFDADGPEKTIFITRSNKRANLFNHQVRSRILYRDEEISAGDLMMVVKNNYFWLGENSDAGFIANGDIVEITKFLRSEERYGCNFADVVVRLLDYPNEPELELKLWLDSINADEASIPAKVSRELFKRISEDYMHIKNKQKRYKEIMKDPFTNALQVKFAYAVTCHKAQGGQWPVVFVDQGYVTEEMLDQSYYRWLYTAVSRATEKLYLVNFSDKIITNPGGADLS